MDRLDLIFGNPALRKKNKKKVVAPLILTYNPGNPPVKSWIKEGMEILHKDPYYTLPSTAMHLKCTQYQKECITHITSVIVIHLLNWL